MKVRFHPHALDRLAERGRHRMKSSLRGRPVSGTRERALGRRRTVSRGLFMKDASPEIERRFREMLLARSGEDRLKMGCSMHQCAQLLVRASVLARHPKATPAELRRELLLRFYGQELSLDHRRAVLSALENCE